MNAAEQATSLELTTKIASVVTLFKGQFPMVRADLKPWANDADTRSMMDPDSIDIGFHLPGWNPKYECRSMLVQMRFFSDSDLSESDLSDGDLSEAASGKSSSDRTSQRERSRLIGLEVLGFSYNGEQWRLSTVGDWPVRGEKRPAEEKLDLLKTFCRQVYELFNETQS